MSEGRKWEIYTLSDPRDGTVRYVGVTHKGIARLHRHLVEARSGKGSAKCNWLRELLTAGLKPAHAIVECGEGGGWQLAERTWIAFYRGEYGNLTNRTSGGQGAPVGFTMPPKSAETLRRMSASHVGNKCPRSPEYCAMLSARQKGVAKNPAAVAKTAAALKGRKQPRDVCAKRAATLKRVRAERPLTPTQRANLSAGQRGRKHSPQTLMKLRAAKLGKKVGPHSAEWTAKITAANKGQKRKPLSPETRARQSAALKGRPWTTERRAAWETRQHGHSEETKAKMRAAYVARGAEKNAAIKAKQIATARDNNGRSISRRLSIPVPEGSP